LYKNDIIKNMPEAGLSGGANTISSDWQGAHMVSFNKTGMFGNHTGRSMTTILVVEDDKQTRDFVSEALHFAGYRPITASDGVSGMQLAEEHMPDLIISDIHMPNLDGFQMLRRLRGATKTSTIPVILLTAEKDAPAMREGMLGGAEDFLVKPVLPQDLLSAVKVQLDKRSALDEKHHSTLRLLRKNIIYALPHELRTPLQLISGYANLLQMEQGQSKPEDVLEYSKAIVSASSRLERLIENYLIYAQLELIHLDAEALVATRNHLVRDSAAIIGAAARDKAAELMRAEDLQLDLCRLALRISEKDLRKIILELVDNAFKFSRPGSMVTIRSVHEEDLLYIIIRDEGRGMTADQVTLMGAYMQFGRELYEQQGLGLGFTVAKRLIELHGGAVRVDSQIDKGTVVSMRFSLY
jgi:signal transduction histidine kinase